MNRKLFSVIGMLVLLMGLLPGAVFAAPLAAQAVTPVLGTLPTVNIVDVNDGTGGQTDPHLSGDWVSYTDNSVYGIRFQNLDLGVPSDRLIPHIDGIYDSLSDINGNTIIFMRATDAGSQGIYFSQIDPFGNPGSVVEVSPSTAALRRRSAIGGGTIAYEDRSYDTSSSALPKISLSSISDAAAPAIRLMNDNLADQWPAVSPDGNAIVWVKCSTATVCDIWRAERTAGAWGAPEQVTGSEGNETLPDTNGPVTVYSSNASGDEDIRWAVKGLDGAYVESELPLPGTQRNPNISGNLVAFESSVTQAGYFDLNLYDLATNRLYQLTDTLISESLSDISTGPGGLVRVVWAQPKPISPYDMDVYALSVVLDTTAPVITPEIQGTQGQNGWYTSDVNLSWSVIDNESPINSPSGCEDVSITSDQDSTSYTCSADSDGGSSSATATIKRDSTQPVTAVTGVAEGAVYDLGSVPQAGCASTDNLSGVATEASLALTGGDAQGLGDITATCSGALDAAGNAASPAVVHYTIVNPAPDTYTFTGFFQPVDNPGPGPSYLYNTVKAGSAIPVKFSLAGDHGLGIFASGYPTSKPASCTTAALTDPIEETVTASSSSLSYDALSDTYTYVWKTDKKWVGSCRMLNVTLDDGTQHLAYFQFK